MNKPVHIKRVDASKEDIKHCLLWMQKAVLPHDDVRQLKTDVWWIAYQDGNPVGFASLRLVSGGDIGYLSRAGVLPVARGQGIQRKLIRARVQHARRAGASCVVTDTTDNPPSSNSLISEGFRMYSPAYAWANPSSCYWIKNFKG